MDCNKLAEAYNADKAKSNKSEGDLATIERVKTAQGGDNEAMENLLREFKRIPISFSRRYYLVGGSGDDLIQEGMIGLLKAVGSFREEFGKSFEAYAYNCVKSAVIDAIKGANRGKHRPLNEYISFNVFDSCLAASEPENILLEEERQEEFKRLCDSVLDEVEGRTLCDYIDGFSYLEIAERNKKTLKQVDNLIQRIKRKLLRAKNA